MIDAYIEASWHTCISLHTVTNSHITRCFQSKGLIKIKIYIMKSTILYFGRLENYTVRCRQFNINVESLKFSVTDDKKITVSSPY